MGWFFGAAAGLLLGGPMGAVVGGVLQHMATKDGDESQDRIGKNAEALFVSNLAAIITKVAMADGEVSAAARATIHLFFEKTLGYTGRDLEFIDGLIEETINIDPPIEQICMEFLKYSSPENRMLLLNILYQVAYTDQHISNMEQTEINKISACLHIPPEVNQKIRNTFVYGHSYQSRGGQNRSGYRHQGGQSGQSGQQAGRSASSGHYATLGLTRAASDADLKKAYRTLAMQYHPDKVTHLGSELIDFAKQKFTEINTAYEAVKKERGIR